MSKLETTIWRGVEIRHPADWELAVASPAGKEGQCVFTDRTWQRFDVTWQRLPSIPSMDLLLEKFRSEHLKRVGKGAEADLVALSSAPSGWQGFRQTTEQGTITRAMRYDEATTTLLEASVLWPAGRDRRLENELLSEIRLHQPDSPTWRWRAMGLDVELASHFELRVNTPQAGKIHWEFEAQPSGDQTLLVERISVPEIWLKGSLAEWLPKQTPYRSIVLNQRAITVNGHRGQEILSRSPVGRFGSWRGLYHVRLEQAWVCEGENRLYRLGLAQTSRDENLSLPESFRIHCCQPSPAIPSGDPAKAGPRRQRRDRPTGPRSTGEFLAAVPIANQALTIEPRSDGGALISIELKRPWYLVPPISWLLPFGRFRRVQLDPVGMGVLNLCDGNSPVEKVIEIFAATHKLTFREAQLPVTQYLRLLTQRGILAIVGLKTDQ